MSIPSLLLGRWRSRNLAGAYAHACVVRVRPGHFHRYYSDENRIDTGEPIYPPLIWKGRNHSPWQATWIIDGPWKTLPNVQSVKRQRSFTDKGSSTATIVMDNIAFLEENGAAGLYHAIDRGHYSPMRGIPVDNRARLWQTNEWVNVLDGGWQIEVWEGYGEGDEVTLLDAMDPATNSWARPNSAIDRTFTGIIEECDLDSHPDHITLTVRDFGIVFTDQRLMGNNKSAEIRSPITFADRKTTQGEQKIKGPYTVSSGGIDSSGAWHGGSRVDPTATDWIEIPLPAGYYTQFYVAPISSGMEMFASLWLGTGGGTMDHTQHIAGGWVDLGLGSTPDGTPYFRRVGSVDDYGRRWNFGHGFDVPAGSKLRLTFTNLQRQDWIDTGYAAGVHSMASYRYGSDPLHPPNGQAGVQAKHWILVEDAADVIRMILIWAGFKEWQVEDFGWTLHFPLRYGEDKYYMDVMSDLQAQGNFTFYMTAPTNDDRSIGVPHFEYIKNFDPPSATVEVRDTNMGESMQVKWALADLPYVMRYRGALATRLQGGQALDQDTIRRYMATYYPPWAGDLYTKLDATHFRSVENVRRNAGILRHFTETLGVQTTVALRSTDECLFACVLAAVQYALGMATCQFQIPGLPGIELNQTLSAVEASTGVNSRVWVTSFDSQHTLGPQGSWHMTVGGAFLDTEEMDALRDDYHYAFKLAQRRKVEG